MISVGGLPGWGQWLRNRKLYETGQRVLPNALYDELKGMEPIARGAELLRRYPGGRLPWPGLWTLVRVGLTTGPTPPGWLAYAGGLHGVDHLAPHAWNYAMTGEW